MSIDKLIAAVAIAAALGLGLTTIAPVAISADVEITHYDAASHTAYYETIGSDADGAAAGGAYTTAKGYQPGCYSTYAIYDYLIAAVPTTCPGN